MLAIRNWRQFAATLKAIFTGKTTASKTVRTDTKVTHRKLYIPREQEQKMRYREESMSEYMID